MWHFSLLLVSNLLDALWSAETFRDIIPTNQCNTKLNHDLITYPFPRLAPAAYLSFEIWLVYSVISLCSYHRQSWRAEFTIKTWNFLTWRVIEAVNSQRRICRFFWNLNAPPKDCISGKFAHILQVVPDGILALKFRGARIHPIIMWPFAAVAVVFTP